MHRADGDAAAARAPTQRSTPAGSTAEQAIGVDSARVEAVRRARRIATARRRDRRRRHRRRAGTSTARQRVGAARRRRPATAGASAAGQRSRPGGTRRRAARPSDAAARGGARGAATRAAPRRRGTPACAAAPSPGRCTRRAPARSRRVRAARCCRAAASRRGQAAPASRTRRVGVGIVGVESLGHDLQHRHLLQQRGHLLERAGRRQAELAQSWSTARDHGGAVPRRQRFDRRTAWPRSTAPSIWRTPASSIAPAP